MDDSRKGRNLLDRTPNEPSKFRAVAIAPCAHACSVAKRFANHRFLVSEAPRIPLAGCDLAGTCTCAYQKFTDRRFDYRRSSDEGLPDFGMVISERRKFVSRRTARGKGIVRK